MSEGVLLGDIGGTHSRFALLGDNGRPAEARSFQNDDVGSIQDVIAQYLQATGATPAEAVLAVAAAVTGPEIALTNRDWRFRLNDLQARFGLARIRVVNDFEAQAWALPLLGGDDLQHIGGPAAMAPGPKVVLGPGTGLGVAALVPTNRGWFAVATEAGHVSFGPATGDEEEVFARLRRSSQASAEFVLSGPGLERLHLALHPGAASLTAAAIVAAARSSDATALATTQLFVRLLGRFAGDMALVFKATGGVYVTGGVAQGLSDHFDIGRFRHAFEAHPPYATLLAQVPTNVIIRRQPGLLGCAALAQQGRVG
ncbi:MAG: ROK family protein [Rhizobiales bacterium]|nr:ROK family protein [Hyphomicrobiales bacterium]